MVYEARPAGWAGAWTGGGNEATRVLTIHHVNDEDDVGVVEVCFDFLPLAVTQRRSEVICCHTEVEFVRPINLALCVLQRCEQTRPDIQDGDVHATPSS